MSLSDRDRKLAMAIVPVLIIVAYWFLLLAPKREEAASAGQTLTEERKRADDLKAQAGRLESAKDTFAADYRSVVTLGKAIPSSVDMPSLIVQLDQAARGTGIKFTKIKMGERALASAAPAAAPAGDGAKPAGDGAKPAGQDGAAAPASGTPPASGGSAPTQSQPGQIAQGANNSANAASQQADAAGKTDASGAGSTQTSTSSKEGGLPVGGGTTPAGSAAPSPGAAPGLDSVPLEFKFDGSFFDLADFFHRLKRFVRVTNKDVLVRGRLMTIDGVKFTSDKNAFPDLGVEVKATVYLSPKSEGTNAGATPQGPTSTQTAAASSEGTGSPAASSTPTATATP